MTYLKKKKKPVIWSLFLCISYNLYFLFLLPQVEVKYLVYLDFLLAVCGLFYIGADYYKYQEKAAKKQNLLKLAAVIYQEFPDMEDYDIAEHDVSVQKDELKKQFDQNCDLEDYITKWCHEIKIPLAAGLLMVEKIEDSGLRLLLREQLERISQQLKSALLGCKVQSSIFDIQIRQTNLLDCVKTSLHNNQFFLVKNRFAVRVDAEDVFVYTDKNWLVYMLDQLLANTVKYVDSAKNPLLHIWSETSLDDGRKRKVTKLFVEDNGEGIKDSDIRRIFDKGYTGSSYHNGKYKSTGMGLYMTAKIAEKLGHKISVESEWGRYTRFVIEIISNIF